MGLCFVVGCAFLAAGNIASADGTPRRQYRPTHMGVATSDLVVLSSSGSGANLKFVQVQPDGTIGSNEYAVPAGHRLVVTEVDWAGQNPFTSGSVLRIFAENKATASVRNVVYMSWVPLNAGGGTFVPSGGSSGLLTGFSISSAARLTADAAFANSPTQSYPGTQNTYMFSGLVVLRGYVVPDA